MAVLVTGGAGYIGSHAVQRLLKDGQTVVSVDNLFRGHAEPMRMLAKTAPGRLTFVNADISDAGLLSKLIAEHNVDTVMHFAAMAYVGESVTQPLRYYRNNAAGSLALLEAIQQSWSLPSGGVKKMVFSSTCASYGEPDPKNIPIAESTPQSPINPYGWSKLHTEHMLRDFTAQAKLEGKPFAHACLRYFNVAGSDRTGLIGEHHEPETHLIPICLQVALGQREALTILGTDYPTRDGSCVRDYVHVEDLVDAHVKVLSVLKPGDQRAYNIGIGKGCSVREIVDSVRRVTGVNIATKEGARRPGDPPELYADPRKIKAELGWQAQITDLDEIVRSAWSWYKKHPKGYADAKTA